MPFEVVFEGKVIANVRQGCYDVGHADGVDVRHRKVDVRHRGEEEDVRQVNESDVRHRGEDVRQANGVDVRHREEWSTGATRAVRIIGGENGQDFVSEECGESAGTEDQRHDSGWQHQ